VAQERGEFKALVNTAINLQVSRTVGKFVNSRENMRPLKEGLDSCN
jgi:hypothetical protein